MKQKNQEDSWVICPECKTKLKHENLSSHMKHVHNKKIENFDESSLKVLPKKEQKKKKSMNLSIGTIAVILIILVVIVSAVAAYFVFSGSSDYSNKPEWLNNYTPEHSVGTGTDDFWINFPVGGPSAGQSINHLTWITEGLEEKPVVFVCHKTGCSGCTPQADRVKALREIYGEDAVFYDLDLPYNGDYTKDTETKFYEVYYYDPNGGSQVIAFTGVFTRIKGEVGVKIGWHSWEGNVADAEMETWIKDAIYYYHN